MIDLDRARNAFANYIKEYDLSDGKVRLKVTHMEQVVILSEMIAQKLRLSEEDVALAKLIALLHDIGQFDQVKFLRGFSDSSAHDHAELGAKLLGETPLLRAFIEDQTFDAIIVKSIKNHNKYQVEDGLTDRELLHARIIRDADKLDNFRVKAVDRFEDIADITENGLRNGAVSDDIYEDFLKCRPILIGKRKTELDFWVTVLAFVFDLNFPCSLAYVREKNYIDVLIDRIDYQKEETRRRMEVIRRTASFFVTEHCGPEPQTEAFSDRTERG